MRESDVIVIGGGLAGLIAAAVAAKAGKKVMLMTKGAGTIAIGGGCIDVLGYGATGQKLASPAAGLAGLAAEHPYAKIGPARLAEALAFFLALCEAEGYPYTGNLQEMRWLPTALGTLKPSCLVPHTMDPMGLQAAERVTVVGFRGLKDYDPELIARGLRARAGCDQQYEIVLLETGLTGGRDLTALDIARWLDSETGLQACLEQFNKKLTGSPAISLIPPVLGTSPHYRLAEKLKQATGCRFIETTGLPPAMTGLRLRNMLVNHLKGQQVEIVEQANVTGAVVTQGRCQAVVTTNVDRSRTYYAQSFILATGGFFGGGIESGVGCAWEPIFNLPVQVPALQEEWSNRTLFSGGGQPFAKFGIAVDAKMCPIDATGERILENVHVAGRNLAGYDYCFEKSGNGVAIASGYQAATSI